MNKTANAARLLRLFRAYGRPNLPALKQLIRGTAAGSPERVSLMYALRRAVKPEKWSDDAPHRITKLLAGKIKAGRPQVFRGTYDPAEPLHITGNSLSTGRTALPGWGYVPGMRNHRHYTPWPGVAKLYTTPRSGVTRADFGSVASYDARSFPEIARNRPGDGFSGIGRGFDNAISRVEGRGIRFRHGDSPFKPSIPDIKDNIGLYNDGRFTGRSFGGPASIRKAIAREIDLVRRSMLRDKGPLDQLADKRMVGYATNTQPAFSAHKARVVDKSRDDYVGDTAEMVMDARGRVPSSLMMVRSDGSGYYDATGLATLYRSAVSRGDRSTAEAVRKLFRGQFGLAVD